MCARLGYALRQAREFFQARMITRARSPFLPANVLGEGLRLLAESSILLSFETDFAGG